MGPKGQAEASASEAALGAAAAKERERLSDLGVAEALGVCLAEGMEKQVAVMAMQEVAARAVEY